jgi:hypothetical protein
MNLRVVLAMCGTRVRVPHNRWRHEHASGGASRSENFDGIHADVLETPACLLVMTAWRLHMTSQWFRLLGNCPYLRPRVLSASQRILQNAGKLSTMRTTALVRRYALFPLSQETVGGWSIQAGNKLSCIADGVTERKGLIRTTCSSSLVGEIGIATQRSIAREIIARSGRLPEHVSAQLLRGG